MSEQPPALPVNQEFKRPKLWYFTGKEFYKPEGKVAAISPEPRQRAVSLGVVALNMDRALLKFREVHPLARLDRIVMAEENVDIIVDDPMVSAVAERLEGPNACNT